MADRIPLPPPMLFQIDLTNAKATKIPIPNKPPHLTFFGAGSTTSAPLKPPQ